MKYLIWDFDGTLAFRDGLWSGALAEVVRAQRPGNEVMAAHFAPFLQSGFFWHDHAKPHCDIVDADTWWSRLAPVFMEALQKGADLNAQEAEALLPTVRAAYIAPAKWHLFPDVVPCLETLSHANWRHIILSNHVPELQHIVEGVGLMRHVDRVFNSAITGYEKPHSEAFKNVLRGLTAASSVWMIGDSYDADIVGAEAVGIPAVLVRKTHASAQRVHANLSSLPDFFDSVASHVV